MPKSSSLKPDEIVSVPFEFGTVTGIIVISVDPAPIQGFTFV